MYLNYDVLVEVMSFVDDRTTLSYFTRTCRVLHARGLSLLFRFHTDLRYNDLSSFPPVRVVRLRIRVRWDLSDVRLSTELEGIGLSRLSFELEGLEGPGT